jgi:hypothetical protein
VTDVENAAGQLRSLLGATASEVIGLGQVHLDPVILTQAVLLYAARVDQAGDVAPGAGIRRVRTVAFTEAEQMAQTGQITDAATITSLFRARQAGLIG